MKFRLSPHCGGYIFYYYLELWFLWLQGDLVLQSLILGMMKLSLGKVT